MFVTAGDKNGAPLNFVDVAKIIQILKPIADRWYVLGLELGFSGNELDTMKSASSTLPAAQMTVIVREGLKRCGDLAKFVTILNTALLSPKIAAMELSKILIECMYNACGSIII